MAQYSVGRQAHFGVSNNDIHEVVMVADQNGNVLNSFGSASNIPIAAGDVSGYKHINKFGYTGTDINGSCTIWDGNGTTTLYPYPANGTVTAVGATNTDDDGEFVEVQGLDGSGNEVTETVSIGGAASSATFSRVFRARMVSTANSQDININVGGSLGARILSGNGQTLMAVYTVPTGKTAYFLKFIGTLDKSNAPVLFKIFARPSGGTFNLKGQFGTQGGNPITYDYPVPLKFEAGTDIKVDVTTSGSTGCGATFDIVLVDNPA